MNVKETVRSKFLSDKLCVLKNETHLECLSAVPGCSKDLAAVAALPEQWTPKKCGPILANYLKEREQSHQNNFDELLKDTNLLNEDIDAKVRELAEFLLNEIQQNQIDIECIIKNCTPENSLTVDDREKVLTRINVLLSQRIQDFSNFKLEALALEKKRAIALKKTLQLYFQRLVTVGHRSPKELLHEFDERIFDINQQLMGNRRTYLLLEAKLCSQADESFVRARSALNQMFLENTKVKDDQSGHPNTSTSKRDENPVYPSNLNQLSQCNAEVNLQSKLVEEYQDVVLKMFTSINDQLDNLHKEIKDSNIIIRACSTTTIDKLQNIFEKAIDSLRYDTVFKDDFLYRGYNDLSGSYFLNMQKTLSAFGENFKNIYTMLHVASHLLDGHVKRLASVQKLTLGSLQDLIVSHDGLELANEVFIDIAIEQMRTAPDADKLQQYQDVILVALDRTIELYKQHAEVEISRLEEITYLNSSLINTLIGEYNCFLENNPRSTLPEIKSEYPRNSIISGKLTVYSAVFQTEVQNITLFNRRNGFLQLLESKMSMIGNQIDRHIQLWVDEKKDLLRMRHSLKLISLSIRKERVHNAKEMRLAEIRYHEARLNSHLDAVYSLIDSLPMEASEFTSLDSQDLYPLGRWLSNMHIHMNDSIVPDVLGSELKRLKMFSYASRLLKYRQLFLESLDSALEQYKKSFKYRVQVARISNVRFMSQLKMFSEGGRYAPSEAMKTCTALVRCGDALDTCVNRTLDCAQHRRSQLLNLADQQIVPIQKMVDEVLKNTPKMFPDKKKMATGKK